MISLYEILQRRKNGTPPPSPDSQEEWVKAREAQPEPVVELSPPPPLQGIPESWLIEIQKIVFHLYAGTEAPLSRLVFAGVAPKVGTTTVSYLIAHHLASERGNHRILYARFGRHQSVSTGAHYRIRVGEEGELGADGRALTVLSLLPPASNLTVGEKARWFREFLQEAGTQFEQVILDMPPFQQEAESYAIAKVADGVVLVLRSGESRHPAVNALVKDLESLGINVLGAVLNFREYPIPEWLLKYL